MNIEKKENLEIYQKLALTGTIEVLRPDLVKNAKDIKSDEDLARLLDGEEIIVIRGGRFYEFIKRCFDIFASGIAIILFGWLLLILALAVKFTSKGPALFKDCRVGKNGKKIKIYKFRSMYIDAESNLDKYLTPEMKEKWAKERKLDNDPRITKVGKFLRKTSLDELPQLFNIFGGSISIVGPRPIKNYELLSAYTPYQIQKLLSVKPGLTGYWQVYGRSNVDYASGKRQKEELAYLPKRGLLMDIKIIFLTIPAVLKKKGAK